MHIVIVGAGMTGTVLAVELLRRLPASGCVTLIERRGVFGRGLAYATVEPCHLLNVVARRMSAVADDPDHLVRWLAGRGPGCRHGPDSFIPRRLYGTYLEETLHAAERGAAARLARIHDEATGLATAPDGFRIGLRSGAELRADAVALCTGHRPAALPAACADTSPRVVGDPWEGGWARRADPHDRVLLVGTGLTMVDQVLSLADAGHRGPVVAVSRRGLLPAVHLAERPAPRPLPCLGSPLRLGAVVRVVRREIRAALARDEDWRPTLDGLRPLLPAIWQGLDGAERRRFLRHLRPYWDAHRHRMAPEAGERLWRLRRSGRLEVVAGRVEAVIPRADRVEVRLRRRGGERAESLVFDRVVNCTGTEAGIRSGGDVLLRRLRAGGTIRPDPAGLGIDVDGQGRALGPCGAPVGDLFVLGPPTRGRFWEITAVTEIRRQCADVASLMTRRRPGAATAAVSTTARAYAAHPA